MGNPGAQGARFGCFTFAAVRLRRGAAADVMGREGRSEVWRCGAAADVMGREGRSEVWTLEVPQQIAGSSAHRRTRLYCTKSVLLLIAAAGGSAFEAPSSLNSERRR